MRGPGGAFFLVAIQLLAGTFLFMWTAFLSYRFINRGYYRSSAWVLSPLMLALATILPGGLKSVALVTGFSIAAFLVAVYSQRPMLEWITGAAAAITSVWLVAAAGLESCNGCRLGLGHAIVGMLLLGGITHAMTLGHWYLNQARLPIDPLKHHALLMFGAIALALTLGITTRSWLLSGEVPGGVLMYSSASYWWTWALIMAGTVGLSYMIWMTIKQRSTQSATGLLYIAMVAGLSAQFLLDLLAVT